MRMMAGGSQTSNTDTLGGFSLGLPPQYHRGLARRKSRAPPDKYDEENDPIPDEQEEGPAPVTVRHVFEGLFHNSHHEHANHSEQVDIEHYIHDKSFRRRLILLSLSNSKIGIRVQLFRTVVFMLGCLLYVAEATYYDYWGEKIDLSEYNSTVQRELTKISRFILYTDKPVILWILEVMVGLLVLMGGSLLLYARVNELSLRGVMKVMDSALVIQFIIGIMYTITLLYPPVLRNLFVPLFLLCWPGRLSLSAAIIQSASRQYGVAPKAIALAVFLICFTFTWVCLLHRVELVNSKLHFFDTIWFVLVTLSSVGYGDIHPEHYAGKLLVMLFIILGFVVILPQLEELYTAFQMQRRLHNSVNYTDSRKHVILCSTELKPMVLRDFLAEFFSDPKNLDVHCVVLVEKELSPFIMVYLSHPVWSPRITVIIGSPMRRSDLARARVDTATACFIHTSRSGQDPAISDQHTVISAWSVKNYAPDCKLYVHILLPETRLHLDLADQVLCEGEMKLALMANHVHCPGISTLVTLLLHTFKSEYHNLSSTDYRLYDMCSSCEVYDSRVGDSKYFHYFIGKNFLFASVVAYRKYQVTLLGVRPKHLRHILLNPGLHYVLGEDDICYYIGFTREEYSKVRETLPSTVRTMLWEACANMALVSLLVAGINPDKLGGKLASGKPDEAPSRMNSPDTCEEEGVREGEGEEENRGGACEIASCHSDQFPSRGEDSEPIARERTAKEHSCSEGQSSERNVVKRGLKLLRYHSRIDICANPVVKVNVATPVTTPVEGVSDDEVQFCEIPLETQEDICVMEEGRILKQRPPYIAVTPPTKSRRRSLRRSVSDSSLGGILEDAKQHSRLRSKGIMYSSRLSLVQNSTSAAQSLEDSGHPRLFHLPEVFRRMSSWSTHHPSLGTVDFKGSQEVSEMWKRKFVSCREVSSFQRSICEIQVVLDLEDVAEERELEELEDGRCGGDEEEEESGDEETDIAPPTTQPHPKKPTATCHTQRYVKDSLPRLPYCGCDPVRFHLLLERRPHCLLRLDREDTNEPDSSPAKKLSHHWHKGGIIMYSEEGTEELYHLLLPLRAHYLHTAELRPILLLLGKDPSPSFLDLVSPLPMVHYLTGDINCLDTWLRAGVLVCGCVILTGGRRSTHDQEHMVDAAHILAAQKITKLFPHVNVLTELHYRYNMRFLQPDNYIMSGGGHRGDHLTYLFQPQFVAGRTFCASMLDTMLYQSHFKPYIVGLVRQLLGSQQVKDSAYLWKLEVGEELLKLQTYDRLFQRVVTVHHCIPLGLYRTVSLSSCPLFQKYYSDRVAYESSRYSDYLQSRLKMMDGELDDDVMELLEREQAVPTQSFVLVNPPHKTHLQEGDVLLTLRPHHPPSHPPPPHFLPFHSTHGHIPRDTLDTDCDSGVHYESPRSPPPTLPSSPNSVIVTAECHC